MKAAVLRGAGDIRYEEVPVPRIKTGEMLIRTLACGVCGTDLHKALHLTVPVGTILGHEVCGEVVELGEGVTRFKVGDRVALTHHTPCFSCHYCRRGHHTLCKTWKASNLDPGGFAEYIRVPAPQVQHNTFLVPDSLSDVEAAFMEPLACIVRGQSKTPVQPGDTVLIIGAGPIGILHLQVARHSLAGKVIVADISASRLEHAKHFGAEVVNSSQVDLETEVRRLNGGRGVDLVILAAAVPRLLQQAVRLVDLGGTVNVFVPLDAAELPLDARRFFDHEVSIVGAFSSGPPDLETAMTLLTTGAVKVAEMATHRLGLDRVGEGIELVRKAEDGVMKVVITPHAGR